MDFKELCVTDVAEDLSERVHYELPQFHIFIEYGILSRYPNYAAVSHWHDDVELVAVLSGHMWYNVNGKIFKLEEGNGIFVNSKQLHYGYSEDFTECEFICILIHPLELCTSHYIEREFISPLITNEAFPCCTLHKETDWENGILEDVKSFYSCQHEASAVLKILSLSFSLWKNLYDHACKVEKRRGERYYQLTILKEMVGYIQQHYKEKIGLEDVAAAGKVCKSNCCSIFKRYLKQTPVTYITMYRLKQSIDLMRTTDMTITQISYETGFSGASYYTETFRKYYGCSPSEYRSEYREISKMPREILLTE